MQRTFKYRIYANRKTTDKLEKWLELCRELYNSALAERIYAWKMQSKYLRFYDQAKEIPEIKKTFIEYKEINSEALRTPLKQLEWTFRRFIIQRQQGKWMGLPRFKGKNRYNSITFEQSGWHLNKHLLYIHRIGHFKIKLSREIEGNIKTITIRKTITNKWFACFNCDNVPNKILPKSNKVIGIDMGIKSYLTDSEGKHVENPKWLRQAEKVLKRRQRILSRRVKGSKRKTKAHLLVVKKHEKIVNQRNDFLHKLANDYIQNYDTIITENLSIKNMVKNHKLANAISDCSWGRFYDYLNYKAEEAGKMVIKNYRFNPTSKTCNSCGEIKHSLKLSDREWVCLKCGTLHDRDINAAKNILSMGLGKAHKH